MDNLEELEDFMKFNQMPEKINVENKPSIYLKLKAGEMVSGSFVGDEFCFYMKWDHNKKPIRTTEEDPDAKFRFKINFVMNENGVFTAKIFEAASGPLYMLRDLSEMLKTPGNDECNLWKTAVNLKRIGEGKQTAYLIVPKQPPLSREALEQIKAVKLHELK